jgi:2-polyprenyl-6-methoxyphenol hydroxylase-like FAD-dependent oxidoreductase
MMNQLQDKTTDVLIVGAGPAGLMMACQLAIHQVSFRIIDKNEDSLKSSGALIVQARSLEIFEQMGIAADALNEGIIANKVNIFYNGKKNASTIIKDIGRNLSQFPFLLMLEQSKTEKLLLKFIVNRGYFVERSIRFKSFIQDKESVISTVILPDGSEQTIMSKYIIAADGAKSTIRDLLKISFTGKTYSKPIFILDCKAKTELIPGEICFAFSNSSIAGFFPLQGSMWRIDSAAPKAIEILGNITIGDVAKDFNQRTKINIIFQDVEWFSVSHSHQRYAESIRVQNCFLIGDSAHVHTPIGAQGMNTGLQDAFNLAWKLAFVINRKAKQEILDTYSDERLGVSRGFAHYADAIFKLVTSEDLVVKFFRLYVLRVSFKILFPLIEKRRILRQMFFNSISQIGIHYRDSILSDKISEGTFLRGIPRPGDRLPFIEFFYNGKNTNSYEILDISCFNLLVFANVLPVEIKYIAEKYNLAIALITYLPETEKFYERLGVKNTGYYLIRPDIYIAFRSDALNTQHLNKYLQLFLKVINNL